MGGGGAARVGRLGRRVGASIIVAGDEEQREKGDEGRKKEVVVTMQTAVGCPQLSTGQQP